MENKAQAGLGDYLRSEREKRHVTIEQVASATKINIKLLHALEGDNYDTLPAKPFVRGFVTSYARYIGIDHKEVLTRFDSFLDEKSGQKFKRPEDTPHLFVEKDPQADNSKTALSIVMVAFIVLGVLLFAVVKPSLKHHPRGKEKTRVANEEMVTVVPPPSENSPHIAPVPEVREAKAPVVAAPKEPVATAPKPSVPALVAKVTPTPKPAQQPAVGATPPTSAPQLKYNQKALNIPFNEVKVRLTVRAVNDAWVRYQADDRPVFGFILKQGKTIFVRGRTSIRFTTGNPKGIEISYDNVDFQPFPKGAKVLVLPKGAEGQFNAQPFVPVNPRYLSTPTG